MDIKIVELINYLNLIIVVYFHLIIA